MTTAALMMEANAELCALSTTTDSWALIPMMLLRPRKRFLYLERSIISTSDEHRSLYRISRRDHRQFALVTRIAERLYRLELDPLLFLFSDDEEADLPNYRDIIEAEEIGPSALKFVRVVERARFKRFEFLVSEGFAESAKMTAIMSKIQQHNGYSERIMKGILIVYLPEHADYDPTGDILK